jgi:F-type H+-transporting ATPase subunit b
MEQAFGAEAGMPQLNTEFWTAQIFWLILIFSSLYLILWKIFLPKITNSIENRKSKVIGDLNEAQKFKENAEKKLKEYNEIINNTQNEAKKIIVESKKKLDKDIENKKKKSLNEIEKELLSVENEIQDLKKSSIQNVNKIAVEISSEIIKQVIGSEVNASNASAIIEDISKRRMAEN